MTGESDFFCSICSSNNQAVATQETFKLADYLIIQVKRFLVFNQAVTKDINKISCTPTVTVSVTLEKDIYSWQQEV